MFVRLPCFLNTENEGFMSSCLLIPWFLSILFFRIITHFVSLLICIFSSSSINCFSREPWIYLLHWWRWFSLFRMVCWAYTDIMHILKEGRRGRLKKRKEKNERGESDHEAVDLSTVTPTPPPAEKTIFTGQNLVIFIFVWRVAHSCWRQIFHT